MENKKVAFITLGCKVNQYETNAMCEKFINKGYEVVEKEEKADIYIVNTCTVTNMSDRKSRQMLRRVKEINEKEIIVACGCYAQVAKEELEKIDEIDIVLGNNEKKNIVDYVEKYIKEKMEVAPPKIIEEAEVPSSPVSPSMNKNVMMGALAGFALAAAIVILFAIMNDSIKTEDDIERALGIPTLAVIPDRKDYIDDHGGSKKKKGKRRRQSKWRNKR